MLSFVLDFGSFFLFLLFLGGVFFPLFIYSLII
jgi:hypothetical protein